MKKFLYNFALLIFTTFLMLATNYAASNSNSKNIHQEQSKPQNKNSPLLQFESRIFPETSSKGMVSTQEKRATQVGVSILEQGGNAIDAAVAVGFALAVTLPRAGNIGGGGFMMIYDAKTDQIKALDYREKAPKASYRDMFLNKSLDVDKKLARYSILSSGVPGTVAGLVEAHKKFGSMPFSKLLEPAIKLAKELPMEPWLMNSLNLKREFLSRDDTSRELFVKPDGTLWSLNDTLVQKHLANTLERIQKSYGDDFYQGETARMIASFFERKGGIITLDDLSSYRAIWREPVFAVYGDYKIYAMPPPSSGGIHLIQLLNIIREFPINGFGSNTAYTTHIKAEAMKYAYADRSFYLGDPDYVKVPVEKLTSIQYAKRIAANINPDKAMPSNQIKPGQNLSSESIETTHYSIMDRYGNVVSNTYTLNFSFGSGISIPGVGVVLNNEMDDFSAKPGVPNGFGLIGGEANSIEPHKRPLSSMTPVIALKKDKPWLATGSPGGSKIITTVLNLILNRLAHDMNIAEATIEPRIHHQWFPDKLFVENGFPLDTIKLLKQKGHNVVVQGAWGSLQTVEFQDGKFLGYSDTRRPGAFSQGVK
ncbi:gamma-glutamyltransferase [Aliikangiella sp. G2MR2-5]|uniref:gamma-glutamyltransferase n=1 Tax=Aliikangiella sp. G2MR2-5 TaxID=2788943 RepID=UPI0018A8BCE3|nr:gamma-glutamyltransferase [Aliikangiella sp. G2MR2-5]